MAHAHLVITLAEPTVVDKRLKDLDKIPEIRLDRASAEREARQLLEKLRSDYDANLADFEDDLPPIIIVRLQKAVIYIIVLSPRMILTGTTASKIVEELVPYIEKIREAKLNPVLIFYSRKGRLTISGYLYLGYVIENHNVGILYVNGGHDEILEILWHLQNVGKYEVNEDEPVSLREVDS